MEKELNQADGVLRPVDSGTVPPLPVQNADEPISPSFKSSEPLELAHVLFMDMVSFSTMPMEEQLDQQNELQQIVRSTSQFCAAEREKRLICLPTGDGMALVFFGAPIASVECALEVSAKLMTHPKIKLRMGVNTGPVYRVADINANLNVNGGGINMAQRIMDAGDAGHILLSKSMADVLLQLKDWAPHVNDLGEHAVKHGVKLHFYNLYNAEAGNATTPVKFRDEQTRVRRRQRLRWIAGVAALAAVVLIAMEANRLLSPAVKRRRSVAVMGFKNITSREDANWVSTDLAEGLRTELGSTGKLRTISGEECEEMRKDLGISQLESMGKTTLSRMHARGADLVLVGSYTDFGKEAGGRIHVNVEIQDAAAGETIDSVSADGTEAEIAQLVSQTGRRLRTKLGLGELSPEKEREAAMAQPSAEAAPFYADGISKLRAYEPLQARSSLERAVLIDPAFPLAHIKLAEAWLILGYDQKAKDEAKKAFELSANLPFEDRLSIAGRYRAMAAAWQESIAAYEQLYKYSPDKLEYGLKLAEAQRSAGRGKDALAALATIRNTLGKPEGDDPRIDLEEAETSAALGEYKAGQKAASAAATKAKAKGARLLASRALYWSCVSLWRLGQLDKAKQACEEARSIDAVVEDKLGTARAVNGLANILNGQGDLDGAKRLFERALALGLEIGNQRDVSGALNNIGMVLAAQGKLSQAKQRYEEALKIQQEIDFKSEIPGTLSNIGDLFHQQGDLDKAARTFEQAIAAAKESGSMDNLALATTNLGVILFERGNLDRAEKTYTDAIAIQRDLGAKAYEASTLDFLADLLLTRGKLAEAEQRYREAMSIQVELGEKGGQATSNAGLAMILLERGEASRADAAIRSPLNEFQSEKDTENEILGRLVFVRSLLAQRKLAEARKEMSSVEALTTNISQRNLLYRTKITAALVRAAAGGQSNSTRAIQALQKVAGEAKRAGMPGFELEARFEIGEIISDKDRYVARGMLNAVRKEASAKGYLLIAQKAASLAR